VALAGLAILLLLLFWPHGVASKTGLAGCLTEKGVVMYGSDNCENCSNQKKILGEEFGLIRYVNCEFSVEDCRKKNISVYPVWALDGKVLLGVQTRDELASFAGCEPS
jgi:hypothetical protein